MNTILINDRTYAESLSEPRCKTFIPVLSTTIYASGDVLFTITELEDVARVVGGTSILTGIELTDKAAINGAFDFFIFPDEVTLATANAAWNMGAADLATHSGKVGFLAADYVTVGVGSVVNKPNLNIQCKSASGSRSLWLAAISRDTKTYTAPGDLVFKLGFL